MKPEDYGQELEWNYGRSEKHETGCLAEGETELDACIRMANIGPCGCKHIHEFVCKEPDIDGINRGICACGATIIGETFSDVFKN